MTSYNNFNVTARDGETKTRITCVVSSRLSAENQRKLRQMNEKLGIDSVSLTSNQSSTESSNEASASYKEPSINRTFSNVNVFSNTTNSPQHDTKNIKPFTAYAEGQNAIASVDIDEATKKELASLFPEGNICTATAIGDGAVAISTIKSFGDFDS